MAANSIIPRNRADEAPVETKPGKYLTFRIARQDFAMNAECVHAILPMHQMAPLEIAHAFICGFAAVSGRDFPVVDLRRKLDLPHGSQGREPFIVVVAIDDRYAGFIADRVSELIDVRQRDFHNGVLRGQGRPRKMLDPRQILKEADWPVFRG